MRISIFPNLLFDPNKRTNPYIVDFKNALSAQDGIEIANESHLNPLLSLLKRKNQGDVFIFNWFESIPDFKHGIIQSVIATIFLPVIAIRGKKIVWILHNKHPHAPKHPKITKFLSALIARYSTLIITPATEGVELVEKNYPREAHKVHFLNHPTKNRLTEIPSENSKFDLLIWGQIAKYKGVFEFVSYIKEHNITDLNICIVGTCSPPSLFEELQKEVPSNIVAIHQSPSFEELGNYIAKSNFVLIPYHATSILSSGIMMDSLSFGAKVIGPATGAFKDYERDSRLAVYTFSDFKDIQSIVNANKSKVISLNSYREFLTDNDWEHFATRLIELLNTCNKETKKI